MDFRVRPARGSDREPLMSFIKDVWGGHDYIPKVWDDWIGDRSAKMFVVTADGRPIAMNRVRFLEDGSAWLEGVRVHPEFRRMGLASLLGRNAMKVATEHKALVFRLTSGSRNRASHGQVAKMGFREVARFSVYEPGDRRGFRVRSGVRTPGEDDLDSVLRCMRRSKEYGLGRGVLWDGFAAMSLTPSVIMNRARDEMLYTSGEAVAIRSPGREGSEVWNQIGYVSGEPDEATRLVDSIFALKGKFAWKFVMVPQGSPLVGAMKRHGLRRSFSNVLFERKPTKG